jgi:hypothetical protein
VGVYTCVFVYSCMFMCVYICICVCLCVYVLCICLCICVCVYIDISVSAFVLVYVCVYVCLWRYLCVSFWIYVYACLPGDGGRVGFAITAACQDSKPFKLTLTGCTQAAMVLPAFPASRRCSRSHPSCLSWFHCQGESRCCSSGCF